MSEQPLLYSNDGGDFVPKSVPVAAPAVLPDRIDKLSVPGSTFTNEAGVQTVISTSSTADGEGIVVTLTQSKGKRQLAKLHIAVTGTGDGAFGTITRDAEVSEKTAGSVWTVGESDDADIKTDDVNASVFRIIESFIWEGCEGAQLLLEELKRTPESTLLTEVNDGTVGESSVTRACPGEYRDEQRDGPFVLSEEIVRWNYGSRHSRRLASGAVVTVEHDYGGQNILISPIDDPMAQQLRIHFPTVGPNQHELMDAIMGVYESARIPNPEKWERALERLRPYRPAVQTRSGTVHHDATEELLLGLSQRRGLKVDTKGGGVINPVERTLYMLSGMEVLSLSLRDRKAHEFSEIGLALTSALYGNMHVKNDLGAEFVFNIGRALQDANRGAWFKKFVAACGQCPPDVFIQTFARLLPSSDLPLPEMLKAQEHIARLYRLQAEVAGFQPSVLRLGSYRIVHLGADKFRVRIDELGTEELRHEVEVTSEGVTGWAMSWRSHSILGRYFGMRSGRYRTFSPIAPDDARSLFEAVSRSSYHQQSPMTNGVYEQFKGLGANRAPPRKVLRTSLDRLDQR